MSFEANNMNTIHLGNYEEFFVLYLDNELSKEQVKMVDDFLIANPDLSTEFETLMAIKLPMEEFSFNKTELFAESMKLSTIDEELLLYIDDELPAGKRKTVELELTSSKDYQAQHQVLLQAKLDPSEKINYPNKKELYRRTEKVIAFNVWMRVAAAVVIIAIGGILYFKNPPSIKPTPDIQNTAVTNTPGQNNGIQNEPENTVIISSQGPLKNNVAVDNGTNKKNKKQVEVVKTKDIIEETPVEHNLLADLTPKEKSNEIVDRTKVSLVQTEVDNSITSKHNLNTGSVTNLNRDRTTIKGPEEPLVQTDNDRKGSLKGFLRKATRMIEKRTGIDPTNENGELLIGAVAINLK